MLTQFTFLLVVFFVVSLLTIMNCAFFADPLLHFIGATTVPNVVTGLFYIFLFFLFFFVNPFAPSDFFMISFAISFVTMEHTFPESSSSEIVSILIFLDFHILRYAFVVIIVCYCCHAIVI